MIKERTRQVFKPNPEYANAPFELACMGDDGKPIPDGLPMRFSQEAVGKAIEFMQQKKWVELRLLSIPSHMPAFE